MTNKEKIEASFDWWKKWLGLNWLRQIQLSFTDNQALFSGDLVFARCISDWKYCEATVYVNNRQLEQIDVDDIEYAIIHELIHIFTQELRDAKEDMCDHEERVVTRLAQAFLWVRDRTRDENSKQSAASSN